MGSCSKNIHTVPMVTPRRSEQFSQSRTVQKLIEWVWVRAYALQRKVEYNQLHDLIQAFYELTSIHSCNGEITGAHEDVLCWVDAIIRINGQVYHIDFTNSNYEFYRKVVFRGFRNQLKRNIPKVYVQLSRVSSQENQISIGLSVAFSGNTILHGEEAVRYWEQLSRNP